MTTKTKKTFDCVALKNSIQEKIEAESGPKTWKERNESIEKRMQSDPHLSKLLKCQNSK